MTLLMNTNTNTPEEQQFIAAFNNIASEAHQNARNKGWWADREKLVEIASAHSPELGRFAGMAISGMVIALKHSELSEALEGLRHGNPPDDKVPEYSAEEAEYADTIIRIMDTAKAKGLRVAEAIIAKMAMNKTRPYMHGKSC
jgi:hypothetical protein